jgi:peptidoglycan/xylan/chitin deacetylase (PgdA/CDA1 family)
MPLNIPKRARFSLIILGLALFPGPMAGEGLGRVGRRRARLPGNHHPKQVALTFDDGPHPRFTAEILSLLEAYQAHATFFVLGRHAARYPHLIKELVRSGQEVGNHSFSHLRFPAANRQAWLLEVARTELELRPAGLP